MKNCGKIVVKEEMGFSSGKRKKGTAKGSRFKSQKLPTKYFFLALFYLSGAVLILRIMNQETNVYM